MIRLLLENSAMRNTNGTNKDRRNEARFMTNDRGHITALGVPTYGKYAAIIVDVSLSGLQLELETPLPTGIEVKLEFNDLVIVGEVLNQRPDDLGHYRIGVKIREVVRSHEPRGLLALAEATDMTPAESPCSELDMPAARIDLPRMRGDVLQD